MDVAILAVVMAGALNVMFFESYSSLKVLLTRLAFPMIGGVPEMLVVSRPRVERAVAARTVSHLLDSFTKKF